MVPNGKRRRLTGKQPVGNDDHVYRPPCSIAQADSADRVGVPKFVYNRLINAGFPHIVLRMMMLLVCAGGMPELKLDVAELFCGVAEITQAFTAAGFRTVGVDILFDKTHHDLTADAGFIYALWLVMCLHPDGLCWLATVCSSWIWMSRSSTGRTATTPMGLPSLSTHSGNTMVARTAALIQLIAAKSAWYGLEQPHQSLMTSHPALARIKYLGEHLPWLKWHTQVMSMAAWEAESRKPTELHSNAPWLRGVCLPRPKDYVKTNHDVAHTSRLEDGTVAVTGGRGLKRTQAYTSAFATGILDAFVCFRGKHVHEIDLEDSEHVFEEDVKAFESANFRSVLAFLEK